MTPTFDTAFCRLVGIRFPIIQAPIGGLATPELASAVSNAGGLGMLAMTWSDPGHPRLTPGTGSRSTR